MVNVRSAKPPGPAGISVRAALPVVALLPLCLLLFACSADLKQPQCGWATSIPSHDARICAAAYGVLRRVVHAEAKDDVDTLKRFVHNKRVLFRIRRHGRKLRARHLDFLRATPVMVLSDLGGGRFRVSGYLVGHVRHGRVDNPEAVIMRLNGHRGVIVGDAPLEHW